VIASILDTIGSEANPLVLTRSDILTMFRLKPQGERPGLRHIRVVLGPLQTTVVIDPKLRDKSPTLTRFRHNHIQIVTGDSFKNNTYPFTEIPLQRSLLLFGGAPGIAVIDFDYVIRKGEVYPDRLTDIPPTRLQANPLAGTSYHTMAKRRRM